MNYESSDTIREVWVNEKYNNLLTFSADKSAIILSVIDNDKLLGFLWAYQREESSISRVHITEFVVHEDYQHLGIGTSLLSAIEKEARKKEIHRLELLCEPKNNNALSFYTKNNFRIIKFKMEKKLK
jgi:ribosomal protein S18 acetylase RimI-like enzyme